MKTYLIVQYLDNSIREDQFLNAVKFFPEERRAEAEAFARKHNTVIKKKRLKYIPGYGG